MPTNHIPGLAAAGALLLGCALASPAQAVDRIQSQNAAGVCQGALPVYDTSLRNRPSAVSNEGSNSAFVSCSMEGDYDTAQPPTLFGAIFANNTAADKTVNCTFVDGTKAVAALVLLPKSVMVPANAAAQLVWNPDDDNGGTPFTAWNNLSCSLPAGIEIQVVVRHVEDGSAAAL